MMTHENAGWLYYKAYFKDIDFLADKKDETNEAAFNKANRRLGKVKLADPYTDELENYLDNLVSFEAKTLYPGLLIGSGYQHETHRLGEYNLGFFFDHTLGLPMIPGSTVKGVLRSAFKHAELIKALLEKPDWKEKEVKELEQDIFEGKDPNPKQETDSHAPPFLPRPMSKHAVFFDGIMIDQSGEEGILQSDSLTPHNPTDKEYGQFKNPIPISL